MTVGGVNTGLITYPEGRYEKYVSRIKKLSKILAFIRAHKIAICIGTGLFTAAVLTFMFFIGAFIGGFSCDNFTYGDPPATSVNAFLADVTYQYTTPDAEMWTDVPPIVPGEYRIRAVSENPFGMKRYTEGVRFTLMPRKLILKISDTPCQYGDLTDEFLCNGISIMGIAKGDAVTDIVFERYSESWELVNVNVASYRIVNADGKDVTEAYEVIRLSADITVLPREITVSTEGGEKEYDGLPALKTAYEITKGTLASGDSISLLFLEIPAEAGSYSVIPDKCSIISETGEDITYKYDIAFDVGVFEVIPRPLTFTTEGSEKLYDGTPLTNPNWEYTGGSLLSGHTFYAEITGSRTAAGEGPNTLSVTVTDSEGVDMTGNYQIIVEEGTLKILPIVLKFTTESAEKVYDGIRLIATGYRHIGGEILPNHRMICSTRGEQTDVGESPNGLKAYIYDENDVYVTEEGYKIEVEPGILRVTPRPITVASDSFEKKYDGTPLVYHSYYIKEGSMGLNDSITGVYFTGSQTEVGESPNTFTVYNITGLNGAEKLKNYSISYSYGTLRVVPNDDYTGTASGSGGSGSGGSGSGGNNPGGTVPGGSGTPGGGSGSSGSSGSGGGGTSIGFPPTDISSQVIATVKLKQTPSSRFRVYLRASSYGDYTGSGFSAPIAYESTFTEYVSALDFIGRSAQDLSMNSSIIDIERYEGSPVLIPYYSLNTQEFFGQSDIYFESDIMKYSYTFYELPDIVSVMELKGATYVNDKYEQSYNDYVYSEYLQIPSSTREALLRIAEENGIGSYDDQYIIITEIQNFIRTAATYNLYAEEYPEGVDVAVYFLEEAKEGICQHYAAAATMMYRAFGIPARYVTGFAKEVTPDTSYDITAMDAHAWVEIYLSGLGWVPVEVTGSDAFELPDSNKKPLVIRAYSASKQYDGMPCGTWENDKYSIVYGKLKPGHTIKVTVSEGGAMIKTPGVYKNMITQVVVYDENGKDVTKEQYVVVCLDGETIVKKRKITIRTGSAEKVYDGQPLSCEEWYVSSGSLPPNTTLTLNKMKTLSVVGTVANRPDEILVYEHLENGTQILVNDYYEISFIYGTLTVLKE